MNTLTYKIIGLGLILLLPNGAFGITLTNREATEQKFTVIEGDQQTERTIKAGEKVELCPSSCVIRLPDGEDYDFDGPEIVSLEDGLLFLDNPGEDNQTAPQQ